MQLTYRPELNALRAILTLAVLALGAAAIVAVAYRPVWSPADDTVVLRAAGELGWSALVEPHAGYLIIVQRAVSLIEGPNPLLIGALASYLAVVAVALFLARRVHPALVIALVLAPAYSVYGSLSNIQWILAVYLLGMLVATPPTSTRGRMGDAAGLLACGLTGPFAVFFLPLYAIRAINPVWRWHLFFVAWAAALQVMTLIENPRPPAPGHDVLVVLLARDALPIALIVLAGLRLRLAWMAGGLYVAVLIALLGITSTYHTTTELLEGDGQRYFYLPWVIAIGIVLLALLRDPGHPDDVQSPTLMRLNHSGTTDPESVRLLPES